MHEASIAAGLLDIAVRECREKGFEKVVNVNIRIGKASGVMPEALLFAFDALKSGTIAAGASLAIKVVPVSGHCSACSMDFTVDGEYVLCCPLCGSGSFTVKTGRELDLTELEVD